MATVDSGNISGDTLGVVFILSNEAMPDFVKVGFTTDIEGRMRELERVGATPFPWGCVYAAEVENPGAWMRMVREVYSKSKVSICFFESAVAEGIEGVFRLAKGKEVKLGSGKKPRAAGSRRRWMLRPRAGRRRTSTSRCSGLRLGRSWSSPGMRRKRFAGLRR